MFVCVKEEERKRDISVCKSDRQGQKQRQRDRVETDGQRLWDTERDIERGRDRHRERKRERGRDKVV